LFEALHCNEPWVNDVQVAIEKAAWLNSEVELLTAYVQVKERNREKEKEKVKEKEKECLFLFSGPFIDGYNLLVFVCSGQGHCNSE
jgi:hypothetical protein